VWSIDKSTLRPTLIFGLAVSTLLLGCTPRNGYVPPSGSSADAAATIVGDRLAVAVPLIADIRVAVSAVDGKLTVSRAFEEDKPTIVAPGSHLVQIVASQGRRTAGVAIRAEFEAGRTYKIRLSKSDETAPTQIWLEDAQSGLTVGNKIDLATDFSVTQ
jgi:hypothetical protein